MGEVESVTLKEDIAREDQKRRNEASSDEKQNNKNIHNMWLISQCTELIPWSNSKITGVLLSVYCTTVTWLVNDGRILEKKNKVLS